MVSKAETIDSRPKNGHWNWKFVCLFFSYVFKSLPSSFYYLESGVLIKCSVFILLVCSKTKKSHLILAIRNSRLNEPNNKPLWLFEPYCLDEIWNVCDLVDFAAKLILSNRNPWRPHHTIASIRNVCAVCVCIANCTHEEQMSKQKHFGTSHRTNALQSHASLCFHLKQQHSIRIPQWDNEILYDTLWQQLKCEWALWEWERKYTRD